MSPGHWQAFLTHRWMAVGIVRVRVVPDHLDAVAPRIPVGIVGKRVGPGVHDLLVIPATVTIGAPGEGKRPVDPDLFAIEEAIPIGVWVGRVSTVAFLVPVTQPILI